MMKPLRKRHLQVWILLGLILPAGFILAWISGPKPHNSIILQPAAAPELPVIVRSMYKDEYRLNLRTNADSSKWQLQWINNKVLTFPSATIYKTDGNDYSVSKSELVGRIESKGNYLFNLRDPVAGTLRLFVYDFIHDKEIERINF